MSWWNATRPQSERVQSSVLYLWPYAYSLQLKYKQASQRESASYIKQSSRPPNPSFSVKANQNSKPFNSFSTTLFFFLSLEPSRKYYHPFFIVFFVLFISFFLPLCYWVFISKLWAFLNSTFKFKQGAFIFQVLFHLLWWVFCFAVVYCGCWRWWDFDQWGNLRTLEFGGEFWSKGEVF